MAPLERLKDGMDGKHFVEIALRNSLVVEALNSAIFAMALTQGSTITLNGLRGKLNFEREISKLRDALCLLGVDPTDPLPAPRRRRERR